MRTQLSTLKKEKPFASSHYFPELNIITAEIHQGQSKQGVRRGGNELLKNYLIKNLASKYFDIKNYNGSENRFSKLTRKIHPYFNLFKTTKKTMNELSQTLILGGDHSLSLATLPAIQSHYPNLKVLWVDAHGDINTPHTSPSGHLHGMPVAGLLGLFPLSKESGWEWFQPCLRPKDIVYVGVRDLDWGEKRIIESHGIRVFTAQDVKTLGMASVIQTALDEINPDGTHPLHVSFDVDSLDPRFAPATGLHVPNGLTLQEAIDLASYVKSTQNLVSLEVVEFNPEAAKFPFEVSLTRSCLERIIQNFL